MYSFFRFFFYLFATVKGVEYIYSQRGKPLIIIDNYLFRKNRGNYWRCIRCTKHKCKSRLIWKIGQPPSVIEKHSHGPETAKIKYGRKVKTAMGHTTPVDIKDNIKYDSVRLFLRQPHFKSDYVIENEEEDEAEQEAEEKQNNSTNEDDDILFKML